MLKLLRLFIPAFLILLFISCEREELNSSNLERSIDKVMEDQVPLLKTRENNLPTYEDLNAYLNTAALSMIDALADQKTFQKIFKKALKKSDGDNDVILKYVTKYIVKDLKKEFKSKIKKNKEKTKGNKSVSEKFLGYEKQIMGEEILDIIEYGYPAGNENYYPQIFIPFIENFTIEDRVKAVAIGYKDLPETYGYEIHDDGTYTLIEIDEEYARNNLTAVFSINERIHSEEAFMVYESDAREQGGSRSYPTPIDDDYGTGPGGDDVEPRSENCMHYIVDQVKMTEQMDGWLKGDNDIKYVFGVHSGNFETGSFYVWQSYQNIAQIDNDDLDVWHDVSIDYWYVTNSDRMFCEGEILNFMIYEADRACDGNEHNLSHFDGSPPLCSSKIRDKFGFFYTENNAFIASTFETCGIRYEDLTENYHTSFHREWENPFFGGEPIGSARTMYRHE